MVCFYLEYIYIAIHATNIQNIRQKQVFSPVFQFESFFSCIPCSDKMFEFASNWLFNAICYIVCFNLGPAFCCMNGERIRRENAEQYAAWVEAPGGDDNAGIRLWQDTGINLAVYYIKNVPYLTG